MQHSPRFLKIVQETLTRVPEVSVEEAARESKKMGVILIDVREREEWSAGHAPRALFLSKGILERDIETRVPDPTTPIYCYCGGGYRSALAADNLQKMGYTNVKSVAGGYKAWVKAGLPISTAPEFFPRSPNEKLGGIVCLPRLIDKCRLFPEGKLPGYNYLTVGFDKFLLEFLCLDGKEFEATAQKLTSDEEILNWMRNRLGPGWPMDNAILEFNRRLSQRRPDTVEKKAKFESMRSALPSASKPIETYFDLIDLEEGRIL